MEKNIKLTIAIPTYNRENEIQILLNSIAKERCDSIEVVVCDNASTDSTVRIIKEKYQWVTLYTSEKNMGPDYNFLRCYKVAKGEYVLLMGSDDVLIDGAVFHILQFINGCDSKKTPVIYLNHCLFKNEYRGIDSAFKIYLSTGDDYLVRDKNEFIKIAKARITFMSCLVMSSHFIKAVVEPQRYIGTSFIHTYILMEMTNRDGLSYGVISYPCVAANATEGAEGLSADLEKWFMVFTVKMHDLFCVEGVKVGFSEKLMRSIFINEIWKPVTMKIVKAKVKGFSVENEFKKYIFPTVKTFWKSWFTIVPAYMMPDFCARFLYCNFRPFVYSCLREKNEKQK